MGQKVHPYGFRLGFNPTWHSRWFSEKDYLKFLHEDLNLRKELKRRLSHAGVSEIDIERFAGKLKVNIQTSRPGIIIGKRGAEVDKLRDELQKRTGIEVHINIIEIQRPETDAQLVAESIAMQLERRVAFRRAMKKAVSIAIKFGAKGIRVEASGRLGGAEIARDEKYREGRVPLHTLRADIDYGTAIAKTTAGTIGIKCWIFKGEVLQQRRRPGMPPQPLPGLSR
jgi:small subunit ribosomal protein S3